ncbi:hypothetical protein K457DRAFT_130307 [Linnemannia elongata AG-77]|uniref:Uncharacterized protein n=1 Tax=Linnemannia elongata AG-77 TaxID=1314771 RepID=A0A197JF75_9FUNG|nr:hypothetical protein K457DRAFT_130307 [Linnemannia elongata AG-77]
MAKMTSNLAWRGHMERQAAPQLNLCASHGPKENFARINSRDPYTTPCLFSESITLSTPDGELKWTLFLVIDLDGVKNGVALKPLFIKYSRLSYLLQRVRGNAFKSKRLTPENVEEKAMDEVFAAMLTEKVISLRPTRLEACGVQYIAEMRLNPRSDVEGYLAHVQTAHTLAKAKFGTVWNRLKEVFSSSDGTTYSDIEEMANVQALVEAFQTERYIQHDEPHPT